MSSIDASVYDILVRRHTIQLDDDEVNLTVPAALLSRLDDDHEVYTWKTLSAWWGPEEIQGRIGDIWINTDQESIYIKGEDGLWAIWHKEVDYGLKKWSNSPKKFKHSYHPWLRNRLLQFDGITLGWFPRRLYVQHRASWNSHQRFAFHAPVYDDLDIAWIARHLQQHPLKSPDSSERDDDVSSVATSAEEPAVSESFKDEKNEESDHSLPSQPKRKRSESAAASPENPPKRSRQEDDLVKDPSPGNPPSNPHPHVPEPPAALLVRPAGRSVEEFLTTLSIPLTRHTHLLTALGITQVSYFESLARMPKRSRDEAIAAFRERSFTFIETLVLRNGLNALRRAEPAAPEAVRAEPVTIEAFLVQLCPSMGRHAPFLNELGIDIAHIPVLAQLDADSYAEFEAELSAKGFTWIDAFMIKAGIQEFVNIRQEPLLAA